MKRTNVNHPTVPLVALRTVQFLTIVVTMALSATLPTFANSDFPPYRYYVSKNGDNTTGRTWATAWNEMDQIKWAQIKTQQGDSLILDGGVGRMIYRKPMQVQAAASSYYPLSVTVSTEAKHNGQVVIAPGNAVNGIDIPSGSIKLDGLKRAGIFVYGAKRGIAVSANSPYPSSIKNIEVSHCTDVGVYIGPTYYPLPLNQLLVHDNATNVVATSNGSGGGPSLTKCWIYNQNARRNSDGVRIDSTSSAPGRGIVISNCVLGPGLRDGLNNTVISTAPTLNNCLLINSSRNNISSSSINLQNVTSFMTRLNTSQMAHSAIKLTPPTSGPPYPLNSAVKQSIIYGGMVDIPLTIPSPYHTYPPAPPIPFPIVVERNTQFRTTGNTLVLAPTMVNPQFRSPVALLPNQTPISVLMGLDFSLQPNSPAAATGSAVTSVKNLLSTFD